MWSDVRADFPAEPVNRFMPGADSGTFDYFTEVINGEVDAATQFATQSEDDNVLVTGVAGDVNAIAFFGYAYFVENAGQAQGGRGRRRRRLRRADRGDDQRQQLRPAQPPAVHLPGRRQGQGAAGAEGVRRLLPRQHEHARRPKSATSRCPTTSSRRRRTSGRPPSAADVRIHPPPARTGPSSDRAGASLFVRTSP